MQKAQIIQTRADIQKLADDAWLGLGDISKLDLADPYSYLDPEVFETPGLAEISLLSHPEYLAGAAKVLMGVQLLPFQSVILSELWNRPFPMFLASRGAGKSWLLALYSMLKLILTPPNKDGSAGCKIVITGAAFRQAKVVFEYMETLWRNAPLLRDLVGKDRRSGPRRDIDRCTMTINENWACSVPLGTGEKIRGLRANIVQADEFGCLGKETLIQTDRGLVRIGEYLDGKNYKLLNMNNEFEQPSYIHTTPKTNVYKITTACGYTFRCSEIHKVMTSKGWVLAKDLSQNDFLELYTNDYFPSDYVVHKGRVVDEQIGWMIGLLISEGTNTNRNFVEIPTTDVKFKDKFLSIFTHWKCYTREAYVDNRGWKCQKSYRLKYHSVEFREWLRDLGVTYVTSHEKTIPWCILQSPRNVVIAFLNGLFYGDGTGFIFKSGEKIDVGVNYYSVCERLIDELKVLLLKFDITCTKISRKSKISKNLQWMLTFRAINAKKIYDLLQLEQWKEKCSQATFLIRKPGIRKNGNRFIVQTTRNNRNVHIGTFDTVEECKKAFDEYWLNANPSFRIKSVELLPEKEVLYDFYMPETHSFYGNGFLQHNSIPPDIFETVVQGFASVSSDPFAGVKKHAKRKMLKEHGEWNNLQEEHFQGFGGNQIIISGTCSYDFQHFAAYYRKYKDFILSKKDPKILEKWFGDDDPPEYFNPDHYSIIRIPYELVPKGFMDDKVIARAQATIDTGTYMCEFSCCFAKDSQGFFKRSLIEGCVANELGEWKPIQIEGHPVIFDPQTKGNPSSKYVIGIDPASEHDNFAIVVIEVLKTHNRVVHCWTTNRKDFQERKKRKMTDVTDFYGFCARKVRDLIKMFPLANGSPKGSSIAVDSQGGGIAVMEALHDADKLKAGEIPIWPIVEDKPKDSDNEGGLHCLELIHFSNYEWVAEANHGLRKDMEDKVLLFPRFDPVSLELAYAKDKVRAEEYKKKHHGHELVIYDSLEDCVMEIEALKDELTSIIVTHTGQRERWDTPEVKTGTGKKGRMRKDRYSALLMANMLARQIQRAADPAEYEIIGGVVRDLPKTKGDLYTSGPEWYTSAVNKGGCFIAINRNR